MKEDSIIFIAFCVFIVLWGIHIKQRFDSRKKVGEGILPEKEEKQVTEELQYRKKLRERRLRFWTMVQWGVLGGLIVYMVPILIQDLRTWENVGMTTVFLRCLIFIFTIYIFLLLCRKVFGRKHKEKAKE